MRSSKNRSRNKQTNRPRTLGNIINRVFDSSGPEGKVRGTPQQIIEKYQMLARDAQLSNDRVAAENFLQHAEHYTRLLAEATREMAAEQEARQQSQNNAQNNAQNHGQNHSQNHGQNNSQNHGQNNGNGRERSDWRGDRDYRPEGDEEAGFLPARESFAVIDGDEQPIVDFPEARRDDRRERYNSERPQGDRPQPDRNQGDRPQGERQGEFRPRNDQQRNDQPRNDQPRHDRPRDDKPRDNRPRDNRPRDERPREERPRDDRPRDDRPRDDRREPRVAVSDMPQPVAAAVAAPITERTPQPELPAFITGPVPVVQAVTPAAVASVETAVAPKPKRAPRKPKEEAPADPSA